MWYEDARTELAKYKELECDGIMWEDEPKGMSQDVHDYWSRVTWDKFDHLPIAHVEEIIDSYADLRDLLTKKDATIGDAYDIIYQVENWTFDDVKEENDRVEEAFTRGEIEGYDYICKANRVENAFGIEETQCICYCCSHSGDCPMEDAHNTTYGTFVTECHYYDYVERD